MYRVMLADDEGIVIDSLRFIVEKHFEGQIEIESAKTGETVEIFTYGIMGEKNESRVKI